jgi:hypothetical protein
MKINSENIERGIPSKDAKYPSIFKINITDNGTDSTFPPHGILFNNNNITYVAGGEGAVL